MFKRLRTYAFMTSLVVLVGLSFGCDRSSPSLTQPTPQPAAVPQPPVPVPSGPTPSVTAVTPNAGSTGGDTWGTITGTGFLPGATVIFGDRTVRTAMVRASTTMLFWTGPHAAGTVDVVVTNPGGLAGRLTGGYAYALPESFDFNGDWVAHAGSEYETDMRFAIRNNMLVSLSCGTTALTLSSPPSVRNGEFSSAGAEGIAVSGRLVSAGNAVGTIDIAPCATRWWADRDGEVRAEVR
jgi:IPT/TIG domain